MNKKRLGLCALSLCAAALSQHSIAGEDLFGYLKGAEALPEGASELYQKVTVRDGKSVGS